MASYRKFDAPNINVAQGQGKAYEAAPFEALRKAFIGLSNRVLGGTSGTGQVPVLAGCGTGASGGAQINNVVAVTINGRLGTITAQTDLELPAGTQAAATYVKYLISSGFGSSGTVTAGNEGADSTSAHIPDVPDGHAPLGYVEYAANGTRAYTRTNGVLSGNTGGTNGTVSDWEDLIHMPYADTP